MPKAAPRAASIEHAREEVAALVGARPGDVFFTSSGTEANMLALTPAIETAAEKQPRDRLLLSAIEHVSVRAGGRFPRDAIEELPVDADGRVESRRAWPRPSQNAAAAGVADARQ